MEAKQPEFKEPILSLVYQSLSDKIAVGQIGIPKDYHVGNALQAAWFKISEMTVDVNKEKVKATVHCTKESIAEALFKMVAEGMNPSKHQCAFIVYKNILTYQREYQGTIALAKRYSGVKEVNSGVVYEGQILETIVDSTGVERLVPYKPNFDDMDKPIKGAWTVVIDADGKEHLTKMTMKMIQEAWEFSKRKYPNFKAGEMNDTQSTFTDQMAMKTVVNRACKPYINTSSDELIMNIEEPVRAQIEPRKPRPSLQVAKEVLKIEAIQTPIEKTETAEAPANEPKDPEWA